MENVTILHDILIQVTNINTFLQIFFWVFILLLIVYFGYWFFSRFFY